MKRDCQMQKNIIVGLVMVLGCAACGDANPEAVVSNESRPAKNRVENSKIHEQVQSAITVEREMYIPSGHNINGEPVAGWPLIYDRYIGNGLRREESLQFQRSSDLGSNVFDRYTEDNGKTWSKWQDVRDQIYLPVKHGYQEAKDACSYCYDPVSGKSIIFFFHCFYVGAEQTHHGRSKYFHSFWQLSDNEGRTWSPIKQFRYEGGDSYIPGTKPSQSFLDNNQMMGSYSPIATREGTIVFPVTDVPLKHEGKDIEGVLVFIGTWNKEGKSYNWEVSEPITVAKSISNALSETTVAQLKDGRLLLDMRGSNYGDTSRPGRRWSSLSEDGGLTWSDVTDLRYDTGEQFYSPESLSIFSRHSNGRLYWFGNISKENPNGKDYRYPLYIAEVDETIPALKKRTLAIIESSGPEYPGGSRELSNFRVFENRQTGKIETKVTFAPNIYKYTIYIL